MKNKLEEIFDYHYDSKINIETGKFTIHCKVMTKEVFVKLISKMLTQDSLGNKFKDLKEQHKYYGVSD